MRVGIPNNPGSTPGMTYELLGKRWVFWDNHYQYYYFVGEWLEIF